MLDIESLLHSTFGAPRSKTNKDSNWESRYLFSGDWSMRYVAVRFWQDAEAVAFKLKFADSIADTKMERE
jgi:hypothetical protein